MRRSLNFFPLPLPFLLALAVLASLLLVLVQIGAIAYAYERMGVPHQYVFSVLALSLVGSYVNIPVWQFPEERIVSGHEVRHFGMRYVIPTVEHWPGTVIAVNVGGAVVPTLLALHLIARNGIYLEALLGVSAVALVIHRVARPIPGLGIGVPALLPPLLAATFAVLIAHQDAAPLAYVSGTLGTLLGADLLNLTKVRGLGAPIASIGGAGTFDGIFLTGILAVLLA